MAEGLQVYNGQGKMILDYTSRIGRFIGAISPNGAVSGSITNSLLTTGTPFYIMQCGTNYSNVACYVTFSGNTLSWFYDKAKYPNLSQYGDYTTGQISPSDVILYGVF